ncbi:MAG: hypothetical protein ACI945_001244 [Pseudohongiellaceae bacterium]|jgi:hypothetical protein
MSRRDRFLRAMWFVIHGHLAIMLGSYTAFNLQLLVNAATFMARLAIPFVYEY